MDIISKSYDKTSYVTKTAKAATLIQQFFKEKMGKFIKPISGDINRRIETYNYLVDAIHNDPTNNRYCMRLYKKNENSETIFRIGNKILLKKQIGSESVNGIVFNSTIRNKPLYRFATKVAIVTPDSEYDLAKLKILSNAVLTNKCPHFPILYISMRCNSFMDLNESSYSSSSKSLKKKESSDLLYFYPELIKNNRDKQFMFLLNELANGDLHNFIFNHLKDDNLLKNALTQVYLSLMFYYSIGKAMHNDAHWGNFLYHKIDAGGYFHYKIIGIDYYVENLGYLWVIWDYELSTSLSNRSMNYMDMDFKRIICAFYNDTYKFSGYYNEFTGWVLPGYKMNEIYKKSILKLYDEMFADNINRRPIELKSSLAFASHKFEIYINWILQLLNKNGFILTSIQSSAKIINSTPYEITAI